MSPLSCTAVGKLLLISSLQLLDSIRDELQADTRGLLFGEDMARPVCWKLIFPLLKSRKRLKS
jgi:hypothetical protein